jgi:hypothetical protein
MAKVENVFEVAQQSLILSPKTTKVQAFIYRSVNDLENLVRFLGVAPKVIFEKGKMTYQFGKILVPDNSIIMRDSYGTITRVLTYAEANDKYDIAAQRDFDIAKDSQTPEVKAKVVRAKKA